MTVWRRLVAQARENRGATVVEFAMIFPLLAILAFGAIDFGRAFFIRNSLLSAAREGARAGAVYRNLCTDQANAITFIRTKARGVLTRFGGPVPTDAQLTVLIVPSTVADCQTGPTRIRVNVVAYPFTPLTPVMGLIGRVGGFALNTTASYRYEWAGN